MNANDLIKQMHYSIHDEIAKAQDDLNQKINNHIDAILYNTMMYNGRLWMVSTPHNEFKEWLIKFKESHASHTIHGS